MSFTSKNGSISSQVYESLTRASRRRQDKAWKEYRTSSGFISLDDYYSVELMETSYRQAVYDTLKKLDDLENVQRKVWEESVDAMYKDWENGVFDWPTTDTWHANGLR